MGMYDVESQALPYGSADSAAFRGIQTEMMRRMQMQAEQEKLARQAELDARQRAIDEINKKVALENLASNVENRQAESAKRNAEAAKLKQADFLKTVAPGAVSPDVKKAGTALGLGHLFLSKPRAAVPGTVPLAEGEVGPELPAQPAGEDITYSGTPDQQQEEKERTFLEGIASGAIKVDRTDPLQVMAKARQAGLKTVPAGVLVPKASQQETKAAHDLKMEALMSKVEQGYKPDVDEAADLKVWRGFNPTQAEKNVEARGRQAITIEAGDTRSDKRYAEQARKSFRAELGRENALLDKDLERVDRAKTLLESKTFVADAVAAPEFLQIVAGGMGSGLRMTDAELNRINSAQTKLEQWRGQLAKLPGAQLFGIEAKTIGDNMRNEMKRVLGIVEAARSRRAKLQSETLRKIGDAGSPDEVDELQAGYWERKHEVGKTFEEPTPVVPVKMTPGLTGLANRK